MRILRHPSVIVSTVLLLFSLYALSAYDFHPSAFIHLDSELAAKNPPPAGVVVFDVPGYDGGQYYMLSRRFASVVSLTPPDISLLPPGPYAYQRMLLPVVATIVSLGQAAVLPWALFLINIFCLLWACVLVHRSTDNVLAALAVALCPAAFLGVFFSLAGPLGLLLVTASALRMVRDDKVDGWSIALLSLAVLTREILFVYAFTVGVWRLSKWNIKECFLLLIPAAVFFGWQLCIDSLFGVMPFFMSTGKSTVPFGALGPLFLDSFSGVDLLSLSSLALACGFVLPMTGYLLYLLYKGGRGYLVCSSLFFLLLMLCMPDFIWHAVTSIGRVITPVYPLSILAVIAKPNRFSSLLLCSLIVLGIATGFGVASITHPWHFSV